MAVGHPLFHNSHSPQIPRPTSASAPRRLSDLLSFQKAEVVYDITFRFAHKFLAKSDRTVDQMIQSARSGKKNISGRQQGRSDVEGNRNQAHQRGPRQFGGIAGRLPRLPPRPRLGFGTRTPRKRCMSASWDAGRRRPTRSTASSWKPARPR